MKQQDLAKVTRIEILDDYDDRCRVFFSYDAEISSDDDDVTALLGSLVRNNEYNVIARIPEGKTVDDLKNLLLDKKAMFTVFTFDIADLLEGSEYEGVTEVWNAESETEDGFRAYSSFNKAYVGKFDEEKQAFDNVRRKLLKRLEDEIYFVPSDEEEEKPQQQTRRGRR